MAPPRRRGVSPDLDRARAEFVAAWGQMGSTWGISRTMAEIHALLYITGQPLNTDEVMERLSISRGNASMSLRALLEWGVVSRVHKRGDRKEYFQADQDVWAMCRKILRERLRREIHPLLASLFEIRDLTRDHAATAEAARHNERLDALITLVQAIDTFCERFVGSGSDELAQAASLFSGVSASGDARRGKSPPTVRR